LLDDRANYRDARDRGFTPEIPTRRSRKVEHSLIAAFTLSGAGSSASSTG
jgi:hypothetical protein